MAYFCSQAHSYSLSHLSFPVNLELGEGKCGIWESRYVSNLPKVKELVASRTSVTSMPPGDVAQPLVREWFANIKARDHQRSEMKEPSEVTGSVTAST